MTLTELLAAPGRLPSVVADATVMLDEEVASKSGITGLGIKAAFSVVKALKPGIIPEVFESLMPSFAKNLEPLFARRPPGTRAGAWFEQHHDEVVQALLAVTDAQAKQTTHATLRSAYLKLRPIGEAQVSAAVPRLGRLVDKHLAQAGVS